MPLFCLNEECSGLFSSPRRSPADREKQREIDLGQALQEREILHVRPVYLETVDAAADEHLEGLDPEYVCK